ncbi:NUDIX domain-containing protein [Halogeometricum borinquense]|uniref:NUDIX domain-containing protein n=1 Tax=Halogeometricum borinquense TaxID=60847 RepID=A0A6C0UF66_9EURY|nr:NUDIX domain-containing protein [Halogeometricum borinquense]QIB73850.1 NUDIX domain-containing protein [Halogeometricum borinquense]QIQ76788.1 NUDIX domain-containing protein [Halogeometricum borinquense]
MVVDDLWFLADEASQRAEQAYHRLCEQYSNYLDERRTRRVSRRRFRTLASRVKQTGAPWGAHTIVYRDTDELLLVRHDGVDLWVLPGGEVREDETYREAAIRELGEEAGVSADYRGLAIANRIDICCDDYETWGVMPVFFAAAEDMDLHVDDPDDEISDAGWFSFSDLPADTRDRGDLLAWREQVSL